MIMEYFWAKDYPEVHKICSLFNLKEIKNPKRFQYKQIKGITQNGPQCGLVALAMCSGNASKELVNNIMNVAQNRNFTINGEIFSAEYLYELSKIFLIDKSVTLYDGELNVTYIEDFLFDGGLILVPYDCDKNHSPTMMNGNKAHWAVLNGIVKANNGVTYVLARHGKSHNVSIWNLEHLSLSNSQLYEYVNVKMWGIPEGILNLRNKAVLICDK